ncbi:phage late control D family protein [Alteromonadaceae bacterium M269]|nr:phage late control D family protein [Alteromonadaceae bacterium M269]
MGLGIQPRVRIEGPGASVINPRILSWSRTDISGTKSDMVRIVVNTANQSGLPQEGATIRWFEGYDESLVDKGEYIITTITPTLFEPSVTIVATAAPWQVDDETGFKEKRSRSFNNMTLGDVFRQVVEAHGFSPRIDPQLDMFFLENVEQRVETDSAFLTRLAKERDAIAKPVGQLYVLAARGQIKTISGQSIPPYPVDLPRDNNPQEHASFINCQITQSSRKKLNGVKARWLDESTAQEMEVTAGSAPYKRLRKLFQSDALAQQACDDALKRIRREGDVMRMDLPGDPNLVAEGLVILGETFPVEYRGQWSIDKVSVSGTSNRYRCAITATVPAN